MQLRTFIICFLCLVSAAGLLFLGSGRLDEINAKRSELKLTMNEPLENAPPSLAFATVALGAFRGLIVDVLWIRADQLKEEGKFFDAKQLAEWITLLQPRFAAVWDFQSWNMAYNISVAIPANRPQERWMWIKNGYELLRDKGIPKNPHNIGLYRSLAWIFQHKIGGITDDCQKYYKLQLYNEMKPLIGPQRQEYYKALADAPQKLEDIIHDPEMAKLLNELAAADAAFAKPDELVNNYLSLRRRPGRFAPAAFDVIDKYRGTKTLENLDIFAKAYYLRHTWKLEPELMVQLNEKYGPIDYNDPNKVLPLDWTLADSHAIYWAALGLREAAAGKDYSVDEINADRIVFQGIQSLYRSGKMIIYTARLPEKNDPCSIVEQQSLFLFPDLRMFDRYDQALRAVMKKYADKGADTISFTNAHRNTLRRAVLLFYQAGHMNKALEIYNTLRKEYPEDEVNVPLTEYVRNRFLKELEDIGIDDAGEIITLMLREAYYRYAVRDDDEAFGREKMAKEVYDYYQVKYSGETVDRIVLPDFNVLRYIGITGFLSDESYPDYLRRNLMERIQIERPDLYEKLSQQHQYYMQEMEKQESESTQQ